MSKSKTYFELTQIIEHLEQEVQYNERLIEELKKQNKDLKFKIAADELFSGCRTISNIKSEWDIT